MASVSGGHFRFGHHHHHHDHDHRHDMAGGPQAPVHAGRFSLSSITETHSTVPGGHGDTIGGVGSHHPGLDTVTGPQHGGVGFSGHSQGGTEQPVATQAHEGGHLTLHLSDGSTITLVGATHIDVSFFH